MASLPIVSGILVTNLLFGRQYKIEWNPGTDARTQGYKIYRSRAYYDGFEYVTSVPTGNSQYLDQVTVTWGVNWYWKVTQYNGIDESPLNETTAVSDFTFEVFTEQPYPITSNPGDFINGEVPQGLINGTNKQYTTQYPYQTYSLAVFLNGVKQQRDVDYVEDGNNETFTMTNAPQSGPEQPDTLQVTYIKRF